VIGLLSFQSPADRVLLVLNASSGLRSALSRRPLQT